MRIDAFPQLLCRLRAARLHVLSAITGGVNCSWRRLVLLDADTEGVDEAQEQRPTSLQMSSISAWSCVVTSLDSVLIGWSLDLFFWQLKGGRGSVWPLGRTIGAFSDVCAAVSRASPTLMPRYPILLSTRKIVFPRVALSPRH